MKSVVTVLAAAVLLAGLSACGSDSDSSDAAGPETAEESAISEETDSEESTELVEVSLGITTSLGDHYIAIIAQEEGFYEKYGLSVEFTEFASGIETVDAIVTGQLDIGKVADFAIINRMGNADGEFDGKLIAKFESTVNYALYVDPEKVTSVEDIVGETILTNPGTVCDYFNALLFDYAGISEDDVTIANISSGADAIGVMEKGDAVADWANATTGEKLEAAGFEALITLEDLGVTNDDYYVVSNEYLEENTDTLVKFLLAVNDAVEWINENQEEAIEIIAEELMIETELVAATFEEAVLSLDFTQETLEHLEEIQEFTYENGYYENAYDVTDYIDTSALLDAVPDADVFE